MIDLCPTGVRSMELDEMRHLPLATWMAMNRHHEHACRHPKMASIFEEALADIEVSGLLRQAEAVRPASTPFLAPVPSPEELRATQQYLQSITRDSRLIKTGSVTEPGQPDLRDAAVCRAGCQAKCHLHPNCYAALTDEERAELRLEMRKQAQALPRWVCGPNPHRPQSPPPSDGPNEAPACCPASAAPQPERESLTSPEEGTAAHGYDASPLHPPQASTAGATHPTLNPACRESAPSPQPLQPDSGAETDSAPFGLHHTPRLQEIQSSPLDHPTPDAPRPATEI